MNKALGGSPEQVATRMTAENVIGPKAANAAGRVEK
jgi:hypothetical protein